MLLDQNTKHRQPKFTSQMMSISLCNEDELEKLNAPSRVIWGHRVAIKVTSWLLVTLFLSEHAWPKKYAYEIWTL